MSCKMELVTLIIGTVMMLTTFAVQASAGEQSAGVQASGAALQATPAEEQDGYAHRKRWQHQKMTQNQYGNMENDAEPARERGFVDEDGDGVNDLAPDHDGDGLPNGQDSDWVKNKQDGSGYKHGNKGTEGGKRCERSQYRGSNGAKAGR